MSLVTFLWRLEKTGVLGETAGLGPHLRANAKVAVRRVSQYSEARAFRLPSARSSDATLYFSLLRVQ